MNERKVIRVLLALLLNEVSHASQPSILSAIMRPSLPLFFAALPLKRLFPFFLSASFPFFVCFFLATSVARRLIIVVAVG